MVVTEPKLKSLDTYNAADKNKAEPKSNSRSTNTDCRIWTIREMKSEKTRHQTRINEFWSWFCDVAEALAGNVENPTLLKDFDGRVRDLDPKLSWEIGPGLSKPWQLVISPNLDRDLREEARAIVACAPVLPAWEFHAARQPKKWHYKLELFPPQNLIPRFGGNTLKSVSGAFQPGITLQVVGNKSVENLAEREGFEPSVQVLARTTV
jgi:hypothetical protein